MDYKNPTLEGGLFSIIYIFLLDIAIGQKLYYHISTCSKLKRQ